MINKHGSLKVDILGQALIGAFALLYPCAAVGLDTLHAKPLSRTAMASVDSSLVSAVSGVDSAGREPALENALIQHIQILASDEYQGREPGTEGEVLTLRYLAQKWFDLGLVSGTNNPASDWYAPFFVLGREPVFSRAQIRSNGRSLYVSEADIWVLTSGRRGLLRGSPFYFVGSDLSVLPSRSELAGRVAVVLDEDGGGVERQHQLLAGGAAAVLTILDGKRSLGQVKEKRSAKSYTLSTDESAGEIEAFITVNAMDRLLASSGLTVAQLKLDAASEEFVPHLLGLEVNLEAATRETRIKTHNLIGKIPGRNPEAGAVIFLSHWDHFGVCAENKPNVICNGAIDNASGLAVLTEIAKRLERGGGMDRDVYFLATSAEEMGLLGARAFAENPPLPLSKIVAAFNIDSPALAAAGGPLAIVGRGMTNLDSAIEGVAKQQKRSVVANDLANAYVKRQDSWALMGYDVPAVLVSSAYGDLDAIETFFHGSYHSPQDNLEQSIELGGAGQDVTFHVALGRYFADMRKFPSR